MPLSILVMTNALSLTNLSNSLAKVGLFWQEKLNGTVFRWNLFIAIMQFAFVWYKYNDLPPDIPLFYSRPWGAEQLASSSSAFLLPVITFIVIILNNFLAVFLLRSNSLLSRLLVITSLLFAILSFIATLRSLSLVI